MAYKNKEKQKEYQKLHKDKINARRKIWYVENKDEINKRRRERYANSNRNIKNKQYQKDNPDKIKKWARNSWIRSKYKIEPKDYDVMYLIQQCQCAICGIHQSELNKALCIDHNHNTGEIRKLLCSNCNSMIGYAKENVDILEKAIAYLNEFNFISKPKSG